MYAGNAGESGWSQIFVENIIQQVITDYAICIPYCEFLDLYFPEIITFRLQLIINSTKWYGEQRKHFHFLSICL